MKIAIVASEAAPFAKTGGLADVAGALPKALSRLGHDPILILPLYRTVRKGGFALLKVGTIEAHVSGKSVKAGLWQSRLPGSNIPAYCIEQDDYFDRSGLYAGHADSQPGDCERFAFFSRAAIEAVREIRFTPDVFHLHDWQTALVAPYLRILYAGDPILDGAGILLTIHNIAHQGIFPHTVMETIGVPPAYFNWKQFEFWGQVNLLKAGIVFADILNTVSPTYAREIETLELGHGLDGVLRDRHAELRGVVNGIDDAVWNPAADPHLTATYGPEDPRGKAACKRALQRRCGFSQRKVPLLGIVSRFAHQKGLDTFAAALPGLLAGENLQAVVLGDGDDGMRALLERVAARHPARFKVFAGYDERLAHRIIAGSDMIVVPSRFEPCGLTQLYALKYGSVPVVRSTGGLADTVCDCTPADLATGRATGFTFTDSTPEALAACIRRAVALYRDRKAWQRLMEIGMSRDWSWEASARRYLDLYVEAGKLRAAP